MQTVTENHSQNAELWISVPTYTSKSIKLNVLKWKHKLDFFMAVKKDKKTTNLHEYGSEGGSGRNPGTKHTHTYTH